MTEPSIKQKINNINAHTKKIKKATKEIKALTTEPSIRGVLEELIKTQKIACSIDCNAKQGLEHISLDQAEKQIQEIMDKEIDRYYKSVIEHHEAELKDEIAKVKKMKIKQLYDEFLQYYFNAPCEGCPGGHPSFWKTITNSPEWKMWTDSNPQYDIPECETLGIMGEQHFKDFLKFIMDKKIEEIRGKIPSEFLFCDKKLLLEKAKYLMTTDAEGWAIGKFIHNLLTERIG